MRRGTTPTHTFTLPFDPSMIEKLRIVYVQMGQVVLTKTEADAEIKENTVSVHLTEAETLSFQCKQNVDIQLKVSTGSGDVLVSDIITVSVSRCLCEEELT